MLFKITLNLLLGVGTVLVANSAVAELVKPPTIKHVEAPGTTTYKVKKQPMVKYNVLKTCNSGEFLFLHEITKKSGFPYWQVRLAEGQAGAKDILVATDARFSLVQNQTKGLNPVVLSEIRNYSTKASMEMDAKGLKCI